MRVTCWSLLARSSTTLTIRFGTDNALPHWHHIGNTQHLQICIPCIRATCLSLVGVFATLCACARIAPMSGHHLLRFHRLCGVRVKTDNILAGFLCPFCAAHPSGILPLPFPQDCQGTHYQRQLCPRSTWQLLTLIVARYHAATRGTLHETEL